MMKVMTLKVKLLMLLTKGNSERLESNYSWCKLITSVLARHLIVHR